MRTGHWNFSKPYGLSVRTISKSLTILVFGFCSCAAPAQNALVDPFHEMPVAGPTAPSAHEASPTNGWVASANPLHSQTGVGVTRVGYETDVRAGQIYATAASGPSRST